MDTASAQFADMQESWRAAGLDEADLYATNFALGRVLEASEPTDSDRAIREAGPRAAVTLHRAVDEAVRGLPNDSKLPDWLRDLAQRYVQAAAGFAPEETDCYLVNHRGHLMFVRDVERPFITAELIKRTSWTGTKTELIAEIGALRDAGFRQFTIQLIPGAEGAIEDWARVKAAFA